MRYWAYIDLYGNWQGQRLINATQYRAVHAALANSRPEFLSLNTHDPDGTQTSFRLVFDLDSIDPEKARHDATTIIGRLGSLTNAYPHVYYSGGKGYHIETGFTCHGERAHEIAGNMAKTIGGDLHTLDTKIYRNRSLFRLPHSPASKQGFFKVRLEPQELDHPSLYHAELSSRQMSWEPDQVDTPDFSRLTEMALQATRELPVWSSYQPTGSGSQNEDLILTPCITKIANTPPAEGSRNLTTFVLARHLKQFGRSEQEALDELLSNPHFSHAKAQTVVRSVVRSTFGSSRETRVGCKGGSNEAALMRQFCDPWCPFSDVPLPTPTRSVSETVVDNRIAVSSKTPFKT